MGAIGVALQLVAISVAASVIAEALCWLAVYRTASYKRLKASTVKVCSRLDELSADAGKDKKADKEVKRLKEQARARPVAVAPPSPPAAHCAAQPTPHPPPAAAAAAAAAPPRRCAASGRRCLRCAPRWGSSPARC